MPSMRAKKPFLRGLRSSRYLAETATAIGYDLETILQANIDKLKARYPEGFTADRAMILLPIAAWIGISNC